MVAPNAVYKRVDKTLSKRASHQMVFSFKMKAVNIPVLTCNEFFKRMNENNVSKSTKRLRQEGTKTNKSSQNQILFLQKVV